MREVTLLAAGGTIAMEAAGGGARPALDAEALVVAVPSLEGVRAITFGSAPGVHVSARTALDLARTAGEEAATGRGVIVTHGTDTLEEVAFLCDLLYAGDAPIVFTGAIRPASAPGADGPANLLDAAAVARADAAAALGVLVAFAGEIHAARDVRKTGSVALDAFGSPRLGPIGFVREGRVQIARRVERGPALDPSSLDATVHIVPASLGSDGSQVEAALAAGADGLVAVLHGAGHAPPALLRALEDAAERVPVVATVRPERGAILRTTYGFEGAERDLRSGRIVCAGALSAAAARIKLLACLGSGLDAAGVRATFAADDV